MGSSAIGFGMRRPATGRMVAITALIVAAAFVTLAAGTLWPQATPGEKGGIQPVPRETGAIAAASEVERAGALNPGLPLPRFVSLKTARANVRRGPGRDYPIAFQFQRPALPVEIVREFENWRLIRDAEGEEGWVHHALLSGTRTAAVAPWDRTGTLLPMRDRDRLDAEVVARIEPEVVVQVKGCDGTWCAIEVDDRNGFVEQRYLWGVYPDERFEE